MTPRKAVNLLLMCGLDPAPIGQEHKQEHEQEHEQANEQEHEQEHDAEDGTDTYFEQMRVDAATEIAIAWPHPTEMRASPTVDVVGTETNNKNVNFVKYDVLPW